MIDKATANETMTDKAQAAFNQAAVKVVQRAKNTGTPIIVWQDGAVKELTVEQFEATQESENPSTDSNGGPN